MERKDFIRNFAVGGSVLLAAPTFIVSCSDGNDEIINNPPNSNDIIIDLTKSEFDALDAVGGYAYSGNLIIIRSSTSQYTVLSGRSAARSGCG